MPMEFLHTSLMFSDVLPFSSSVSSSIGSLMPTSWNLGTFNDKREEILANDSEIPSLVPKNMSKVLLKDSSEVD